MECYIHGTKSLDGDVIKQLLKRMGEGWARVSGGRNNVLKEFERARETVSIFEELKGFQYGLNVACEEGGGER